MRGVQNKKEGEGEGEEEEEGGGEGGEEEERHLFVSVFFCLSRARLDKTIGFMQRSFLSVGFLCLHTVSP